jgi:regulator of protease activity HflC (stomatin/prohibitin superfamily)
MMEAGLVIGFGIFCAWGLVRCWFRVDEGHVAVVTSFGAALRKGKELYTFPPGLHFKLPWQIVHDVSLKEHNLDLSGEQGGRTAMAEDGTMLRFDSILRYVPVENALDAYLFGLKHSKEHMIGLFTCLLRNEIANFRTPSQDEKKGPVSRLVDYDGGSYAVIRRERQALNARIEEFCRARIGERKYGLRFNAVDLTDILPPDELADALNAVINARAEADVLYSRGEGECEQQLLAAEKGVQIAKARAKAAEVEILKLGAYLERLQKLGTLDAYVSRRRAEVLSEAQRVFVKADDGRAR